MFLLAFFVKGFSHWLLLWFHPTGADSYIVQSFFTGFTGIFYWNILSCMLKFMDVYTRVLGLWLFSSTTSLISPNWRWLIYILVFFWKFLSCCQHGEVWHLWNILTSARKSSKCFKFYWENQRCVDSRCSLEPFLMRLIGFGSSSGYSTSCYLGNLSSCCLDLFSTLLGKYLVVLKIDVFVFFFAFSGGQICCLSTCLPLQVKQSQN